MKLSAALPFLTGFLLLWALTGTLAPYGSIVSAPLLLGDCNYTFNTDHNQFRATFQMLNGEPAERWNSSVVLRRILYPIVAFPCMKLFGFEAGGLLTNILLYTAFFFWFRRRVAADFGERSAAFCSWLLATYPGIAYWFGMPYSYYLLPLSSIVAAFILNKIRVGNGIPWRESLAIGVLGMGHDSIILIYGFALGLLMLYRRSILRSILCGGLTVMPLLAVSLSITAISGAALMNQNSANYAKIPHSYFAAGSVTIFLDRLTELPQVFIASALYSNFLFIPLAFATLLAYQAVARPFRSQKIQLFTDVEACVFLAAGILFLVLNLSPLENVRFSLHGPQYARLYQPLIGVLFLWFARAIARSESAQSPEIRFPGIVLSCATLLNASIPLGAWIHPQYSAHFFNAFYAPENSGITENSYSANLARFGIFPWGAPGCELLPTGALRIAEELPATPTTSSFSEPSKK